MTSLDVVLVNWNSGHQLARCCASLAQTARESFVLHRVVVVDNASSDGSAAALDASRLPLQVITNSTNRGFAAACNQGAKGSRSDYLLFLNPDTILQRDSLERPIAFLESSEGREFGICGIHLVDKGGTVARSCARFPDAAGLFAASAGLDRLFPKHFPGLIMREWDHLESRSVDHVIGAFYLVRRSVFEALGGFDERYFVYLEDLDFSLRARQAGWRSYYLATTRAVHEGGGSSEQVKAERLLYLLRSRLRYGYRHFSRPGAAVAALGALLVEPVVRVAAALASGAPRQAWDTVRAYGMLGWGVLARTDDRTPR